GTFRHVPEKLLGQLCSDLSFTSVDEIINSGLHEYLDDLQTRMNQVAAGIYETFFALKTPNPAKRMSQHQTQRPRMSIHVALYHKTQYTYDNPHGHWPYVMRLRLAPHWRPNVLSY